jgi:hypothetical protein
MTLNQAGAMISRALGIYFVLSSMSFFARFFLFSNLTPPGVHPASNSGFTQQGLIEFSMVLLPQLFNAALGFLMIYFSRVVGHWLTKGLEEDSYE